MSGDTPTPPATEHTVVAGHATGRAATDLEEAVTEGETVDAEHPEGMEAQVVEAEVVDAEIVGGPVRDPGSDPESVPGSDPGTELPEDPFDVVQRERDEYLDTLRRLQADFDNYRKRIQRQEQEVQARAAERLISDLLPALDAFELAVDHLGGREIPDVGGAVVESTESKALLQAVALLNDILSKAGLERDAETGVEFDPNNHQAVEHLEAEPGTGAGAGADAEDRATVPAGPVVDTVLRTGYRWKGRVIRPAMVKVRG